MKKIVFIIIMMFSFKASYSQVDLMFLAEQAQGILDKSENAKNIIPYTKMVQDIYSVYDALVCKYNANLLVLKAGVGLHMCGLDWQSKSISTTIDFIVPLYLSYIAYNIVKMQTCVVKCDVTTEFVQQKIKDIKEIIFKSMDQMDQYVSMITSVLDGKLSYIGLLGNPPPSVYQNYNLRKLNEEKLKYPPLQALEPISKAYVSN